MTLIVGGIRKVRTRSWSMAKNQMEHATKSTSDWTIM